jgi:hypothetical protein
MVAGNETKQHLRVLAQSHFKCSPSFITQPTNQSSSSKVSRLSDKADVGNQNIDECV